MQSVTTMIIPAAGYGTRMQQITGGGSKELLEIGGKPALVHALHAALNAGIARVGIVIREGKDDIVNAVRHEPQLSLIRRNIHIQFFWQEKPSGEAGAVLAAAEWLRDDPFVVYYPDNIIFQPYGVLTQLMSRQAELGTDLVLLTSMLDHAQAPPCGLEPLGNDLYKLIPDETPVEFPQGLRPAGIYIATPCFLRSCRALLHNKTSGEVKDREARSAMVRHGHIVHGLDASAVVLDIGNPDGYQMGLGFLQQIQLSMFS